MTIIRIGLDTSKHVFQLHGVDANEQPVLRRRVGRSEVEKFFAKLAPIRIGLEACGGRHFAAWLRLTPKENATGGRHRPGRISRQDDESGGRPPMDSGFPRCARAPE